MPEIRQLDSHVADLIAAGEVVERPASVAKELMENAIDAGATHVTVEIMNGGMSLIRVTDDGCGIAPDQAATAFLRHATSKIATEYDLEAIGTLGFRGEALAAIAAVSRVELITRTAEAELGVDLALEGGVVVGREETGCPVGTTMMVRDLFFNTPARLKFMKRDQAEGAAVFAVIQRIALSHPEVSVKFIREGRQELLTPGDGQIKSAMYAIFGRDIALGFIPVRSEAEEMSVEGFASMPACCRGSRGYQHFFVNGRYVKSRVMQAAVEEAYKNQKMVGKFPGCVLHLTCRLGSVDVNVHPTKTEVKFTSENRVFSAVYHAVLDALTADRSRPSALGESIRYTMPQPREKDVPASRPAVQIEMPEEKKEDTSPLRLASPTMVPDFNGRLTVPGFRPAGRPVDITPPGEEFDREPEEPATEKQTEIPLEIPKDEVKAEAFEAAPESISQIESAKPTQPENTREETEILIEETEVPLPDEMPWQIRGELFRTYIVVEQGETALLIDKHAAHERMNFDRLRAQGYKPMLQQLLIPLTLRPAPEERDTLLAHSALLEEFGFELEEFGPDALAVRQAPDDVEEKEIESTLLELARRLITTGTADPAGARDELLHTIACKAAIKGGWKSAEEELECVTAAVMSGQVKYCPHGRPVAIEMSKKQLEKQFRRA